MILAGLMVHGLRPGPLLFQDNITLIYALFMGIMLSSAYLCGIARATAEQSTEYAKERKLDRALMRQLATGRWIEAHQNVVITGATGVGKTSSIGDGSGRYASLVVS